MATAIALFLTVVVAALLISYRSYRSLNPRRRQWFHGALYVTACAGALYLLRAIIKGILNPPEWDFLDFWINGQIAARGLNYYDSHLATALAQRLHPTSDFLIVALTKPFLYPPPTILFFFPLGWFGFKTAALLWYAFQCACLIAAIFLLARTFLKDSSMPGLLLTAILLFAVGGTRANIVTAQTLFMLLVAVTLFFRQRNVFAGGIWLGICILLKPFAVVLLVYAALRKKWKACFGALAALVTSAIVTFVIFGPSIFRNYAVTIGNGPLPRSIYMELENQSLSAWMFRSFGYSNATIAVFVLLAAILSGVTFFQIFRLPVGRDATGLALALTLALLIYPGSLISYSTLLIVPIILLFGRSLLWPVLLAYCVMNLGGRDLIYTGFATALLWLVLLVMKPKEVSEEAASGEAYSSAHQSSP